MKLIRILSRQLHTGIQALMLCLIAWSIWKLTGTTAWAGLFLGVTVFAWSVLLEMSKPIRKRDSGPNLRNVA